MEENRITRMVSLPFLKKSAFYGSWGHGAMRYRISKKDDGLEVCVYPGPYALEYTSNEKKEYTQFEFSEKGFEAAIEFLNQTYDSRDWQAEKFRR